MKPRPVIYIPLAVAALVAILAVMSVPRITGYLDGRTREFILKKARERIKGGFEVGKVRWELMPLRLNLTEVVLNPPPESGLKKANFASISVHLSPLRLIRGETAVSKISVHGYSIEATLKERSRAAVESLAKGMLVEKEAEAGQSGNVSKIFLPSLVEFFQGDLTTQISSEDVFAAFRNGNVIVRMADGGSVKVKLAAPQGVVKFKGREMEVSGLKAALSIGPAGTEIGSLKAEVNGISLQVQGKAGGGKKGEFDLMVVTSGRLGAHKTLLGIGIPGEGDVLIAARVTRPSQRLSVDGTVKSPLLTVGSTEVKAFAASFKYADGKLEFHDLSAHLWRGSLEASGEVRFQGDGVFKVNATPRLKGIDLLEVEKGAGQAPPLQLPVVGTIEEATLVMEAEVGQGGRYRISVGLQATFDSLEFRPARVVKGKAEGWGAMAMGPSFLKGTVALDKDGLTVADLAFGSSALTISLSGGYVYSGPLRLDYTVEVRDLKALRSLHGQELSGDLKAMGVVRWNESPGSGLSVRGDIRAKSVVWRGLPLGAVMGRFDYCCDSLSLKDLRVAGNLLKTTAGGRFQFGEKPSFRLEGEAGVERVSALLRSLKVLLPPAGYISQNLDGRLEMAWEASWTEGFGLETVVKLTNGTYAGERFEMVASLSFGGSGFEVNWASVGYGGGQIDLSGAVSYKGAIDLSAAGTGIELRGIRAINAPLGLTEGEVDFAVSISGNTRKPAVRGTGSAYGLTYKKLAMPPVSFSFDYDGKLLVVRASDVQETLTVQASVETSGEGRYFFTYRLEGFKLDLKVPSFPGRGILSVWMTGAGRAEGGKGRSSSAFFTVDRLVVNGEGLSWENRSSLMVSFSDGRLKVEPFEMEGGQSQFQAWGSVGATPGVAQGRAVDIHIRGSLDLSLLTYFRPDLRRAMGRAEIYLKLQGQVGAGQALPLLTVWGNVKVMEAEFGFAAMPSPVKLKYASINFSGKKASIEEFLVVYEGGVLRGRGSVLLGGGEGSLELDTTFEGVFNVGALLAAPSVGGASPAPTAMNPQLPAVRIDASGYVSVRGDYKRLKELQGSIYLSSARVSSERVSVTLKQGARITVDKGVVKLPVLMFSSNVGDFSLRGSYELGGQLDLVAMGSAPLESLLQLLRGEIFDVVVLADGSVDYSLSIRGGIREPEYTGSAILAADSLFIKDFASPITELSGRLVFTPGEVQLVDIKGEVEGGSFLVGGAIKLSGYQLDSADVSIKLREVKVEQPGKFYASVSADLKYLLTKYRPTLMGKVSVGRAVYYGELDWRGTLASQSRFSKKNEAGQEKEAMALELALELEDPVRIANELMEANLKGELNISGNTRQPELYGSLVFTEGTVFFGDKVYSLDRGRIDFSGKLPAEVLYEIALYTSVQKYTVNILLTGASNKYTLQFTSEPPLEQADIISLLALGTTIEGLSGGRRGDASAYQALRLLAYGMQSRLVKSVRQTTGLDVLEINTYPDEEGEGSNIRLGKKVTESLSVVYSTGLRGGSRQDVELIYKLTENVYLKGVITEFGGSEVGIVYRLEFK